MGPQNSTANGYNNPDHNHQQKQSAQKILNAGGSLDQASSIAGFNKEGSLSNSFLKGSSPELFYRTGEGGLTNDLIGSERTDAIRCERNDICMMGSFRSSARQSSHRTQQIEQPTWCQLSRMQQKIYYKWHKAHQRQVHNKRLIQQQKQKQQEKESQKSREEEAHKLAVARQAEHQGKNKNGDPASVQKLSEATLSPQSQTEDQNAKVDEPKSESIWSGLQKRFSLTLRTGGNGGESAGKEVSPKEQLQDDIEIGLTVQVNESESIRVSLDLTEHDNLSTFTSGWLQEAIFRVVRERRLATRSASHSKSSTDVPGSEDGLSMQQKQMTNCGQPTQLEPVCLSTVYNEAECIDFLLTQPQQMVSTYLPIDSILKVHYVARDEIEEDKSSKQVPSLRNFDFIKVLGTGGFATVYMVRKRTTGKLYAMKLVKKEGVKQDQVKFAQVYTERQILERLKNPFLVQLHYAFVTTNYYCLVIDLCTGGELFYYLQKNQSFQLSNTKLLFAEVVLAVEFLHKHDILYRDLKPENILVDERGHLRLTDFGLCRANFKQKRDRAMSFVGSPEYMSPEILLGSGYDYSVDFYTLGVLLYEMLVGLPPHYNENKMQMYKDITMKEPVIPSVLQGDARDILERLLKIEPANRLGMGPGGIEEIKNHDFFKDIDWEALSRKAPQPGRKRIPLEVNIFESNFDKQYTRLPITINVAQEELIKINDPILPTKPLRIRSKSFTWKPKSRSARHREQLRHRKQLQKQKHQMHGGTTIFSVAGGEEKDKLVRDQEALIGCQPGKMRLSQLKKSEKTRSQHIKRKPLVKSGAASTHNATKIGQDLNSQIAAIANSPAENTHFYGQDCIQGEKLSKGSKKSREHHVTLGRDSEKKANQISRACSQEVIDQLSHVTASQSVINGMLASETNSHSNLRGDKNSQENIQLETQLKKQGTVENWSASVGQSEHLFKNSDSQVCNNHINNLDVYTELSLMAQDDNAKTMRSKHHAFKNTLQIQAENTPHTVNQNGRQSKQTQESIEETQTNFRYGSKLPLFHEALSPFSPLMGQRRTEHPLNHKNFDSSTYRSSKVLNHHHGHSEYNKRAGAPNDNDYNKLGANGGGSSNQESAFNFRKQTLCDDDAVSEDKDLNSCTEVDLMTNMRGGDFNYFSGVSSKNNFPAGTLKNVEATPNKLINQFSPTEQATAPEALQQLDLRTPKEYLLQPANQQLPQKVDLPTAFHSVSPVGREERQSEMELNYRTAQNGRLERQDHLKGDGVQLLHEKILEEDNNSAEYMRKASPAMKRKSSNKVLAINELQEFQAQHQIADKMASGRQADSDSDASRLFGPEEMKNQLISVAVLTNDDQDSQKKDDSPTLIETKSQSVEQQSSDQALLYVFGGTQGRQEDSMLSEEYQTQVYIQIDPSMTPDSHQTPKQNKSQTGSFSGNQHATEKATRVGPTTSRLPVVEQSPRANNALKKKYILPQEANSSKDLTLQSEMICPPHPQDQRVNKLPAQSGSPRLAFSSRNLNSSDDNQVEAQKQNGEAEEDKDTTDLKDAGFLQLDGATKADESLVSLMIETMNVGDEELANEGEDCDGCSSLEDSSDASLQDIGINALSAGSLRTKQDDASKILAMPNIKMKMLKKRLSLKHQLDQTANLINEGSQDADDRQQVLQYQYGYSVEQQRDEKNPQSNQQAANSHQQLTGVVKFMHSSAVRNVGKHQSSQNISNLIAKSVMGMTPKIFSKVASQERLPNLPESKTPFSNSNTHKNNRNTDSQGATFGSKRSAMGVTGSSLQHHQLINFAEKAAGVISERNRKFSKPQTLKNLEQKLLQADDSDFDGMDDEEIDGPAQVEVFKLELPEDKHTADLQLQFNSEMISIDEFDSRIENDELRNQKRESSMDFEDIQQIDNGCMNLTSEMDIVPTSPVLQFQSQCMANITTPQFQLQANNADATVPPSAPTKPIRDALSSPAFKYQQSQGKAAAMKNGSRNQNEAAPTSYPSHSQKNQTNSRQSRSSHKRFTLNGLLLNSNSTATGHRHQQNTAAASLSVRKKTSASSSPNRNYKQQDNANRVHASVTRIGAIYNQQLPQAQYYLTQFNEIAANESNSAKNKIKDLIPFTQKLLETKNVAVHTASVDSQVLVPNDMKKQNMTLTNITKPTHSATGAQLAQSNHGPSHHNQSIFKKKSSKTQIAQLVGNHGFKGVYHKRRASANKLIMDQSAAQILHHGTGMLTNNQRCQIASNTLQNLHNSAHISTVKTATFTSHTTQKTKQQAGKSQQKALNKAQKQTKAQYSSQQHLFQQQTQPLSAGKTSTIVSMSGKLKQPPPKQPTLLGSPMPKLIVAADQQNQLSLRVMQTPSGIAVLPSQAVASMQTASNLRQSMASSEQKHQQSSLQNKATFVQNHGAGSVVSNSFKESKSSQPKPASSATKKRHKKRLATVSSQRSCFSHNKSGKSLKQSVLSKVTATVQNSNKNTNLKGPVPLTSAQRFNMVVGNLNLPQTWSESAMQIDREVYLKWQEEPTVVEASQNRYDRGCSAYDEDAKNNHSDRPGYQKAPNTFLRSNSALVDQTSRQVRCPKSARQEKALHQLQQIKSGQQSIFEVVDDIMSNLQVPYGASRSPDIRARKGVMVSSGQPLLLEDFDSEPLSAQRAENLNRSKNFYSSHKALPGYKQTSAFDVACQQRQSVRIQKHPEMTPLGTNEQQTETVDGELSVISQSRYRKDGNLQLLQIEPRDLPQTESDDRSNSKQLHQIDDADQGVQITYQDKTLPSNHSERDGLTPIDPQMIGHSPRNALAVLKQPTPFKNKILDRGRNETSVEVLILDGSEFVSQSETVAVTSQNIPTDYDEFGEPVVRVITGMSHSDATNTREQRQHLNATFQHQSGNLRNSTAQDCKLLSEDMTCVPPQSVPDNADSIPNSSVNLEQHCLFSAPKTEVRRGSTIVPQTSGTGMFSAASTSSIPQQESQTPSANWKLMSQAQRSAIQTRCAMTNDPEPQSEQKTSQYKQQHFQKPSRKNKSTKQLPEQANKPLSSSSFLSTILGQGVHSSSNTTLGFHHFSASNTPCQKNAIQSQQKIGGGKDPTIVLQQQLNKQYYYNRKSKKSRKGHKQQKAKRQSTFNNSMTNISMTETMVQNTQPAKPQQKQSSKMVANFAQADSNHRATTQLNAASAGKRSAGGFPGYASCKNQYQHSQQPNPMFGKNYQPASLTARESLSSPQENKQAVRVPKQQSPQPTYKLTAAANIFAKKVSLDLGGGPISRSSKRQSISIKMTPQQMQNHQRNDSGASSNLNSASSAHVKEFSGSVSLGKGSSRNSMQQVSISLSALTMAGPYNSSKILLKQHQHRNQQRLSHQPPKQPCTDSSEKQQLEK